MAGLGRAGLWVDRVDSDTPDMEPVPCLVTVNPQQQWKGCGRCGGAVVGLASCCWRCGMPAAAATTQWSYSRHYQLWQQPDAAHHTTAATTAVAAVVVVVVVVVIVWVSSHGSFSVSAAAPRVTLLPSHSLANILHGWWSWSVGCCCHCCALLWWWKEMSRNNNNSNNNNGKTDISIE